MWKLTLDTTVVTIIYILTWIGCGANNALEYGITVVMKESKMF